MKNKTYLSDTIQGQINTLRITAIAGIKTELARIKESNPQWVKMPEKKWETFEVNLSNTSISEPFRIYGSGRFLTMYGGAKESILEFPLSDLLCILSELEDYETVHDLAKYSK